MVTLREDIQKANLIVIKVGTSSIVDSKGSIDLKKTQKISKEIFSLLKLGKEIILVTSGAIAAGIKALSLSDPLNTIEEKQAAAATGQWLLMKEYEKALSPFGIIPSQVLLTRDEIEDKKRSLNCKNTINQIIKFKALPIINENDTVSVEEIKVGDNDTLSAHVAKLVGADILIILSDVDGFIINGEIVSTIDKITREIEIAGGGKGSDFGTGGMKTKLSAAKIVGAAGIPMIIANSKTDKILEKIVAGEIVGTLFIPEKK